MPTTQTLWIICRWLTIPILTIGTLIALLLAMGTRLWISAWMTTSCPGLFIYFLFLNPQRAVSPHVA